MMSMDRIFPSAASWAELFPDLSDGEREVALRFARLLPAEWRIYVRPFLNSFRPSLVLYHPEYGFGLYEVVDWDSAAAEYAVRVDTDTEIEGKLPVLTRNGEDLQDWANPWLRVRDYRKDFASMITEVSADRSAYGLITSGLILTHPSAENSKLVSLLSELYDEQERKYPYLYPVAPLSRLASGSLHKVLNRANRNTGRGRMTPRICSLARRWLEPPDYIGAALGFDWDDDQKRIIDRPPPVATQMRRVKGPAGSGKSVVVAGRAARLAVEGQRVLVLCFNIALRGYLRDLVNRAIASLVKGKKDSFISA